MKVLIADDDPSSRLILSRILTRYLSCEVVEAEDGIDALLGIERERPDLLLLDTMMPELDGLGVLEAIRTGVEFSDLPVVSVTAVSDRAMVLKLISFGILDYILKPIQVEPARKRLGRILSQLSPRKARVAASAGDDDAPTLLLVDRDPSFVSFATVALDPHFRMLSSSSGAEALTMVRNHDVQIIVAGEGLPLMNERLLASAVRREPGRRTGVYLLSERDEVPKAESRLFDGVIRKTHAAETLADRIRLSVLASDNTAESVTAVIHTELDDEIVPAVEQTFGVMTLQPTHRTTDNVNEVRREAAAKLRLSECSGRVSLDIALTGSTSDVETIAGTMREREVRFDEGGADCLMELLESVAGRLEAILRVRGIFMSQGGRSSGPVDVVELPAEWTEDVAFRCENGVFFAFSMAVVDEATVEEAEPASV